MLSIHLELLELEDETSTQGEQNDQQTRVQAYINDLTSDSQGSLDSIESQAVPGIVRFPYIK